MKTPPYLNLAPSPSIQVRSHLAPGHDAYAIARTAHSIYKKFRLLQGMAEKPRSPPPRHGPFPAKLSRAAGKQQADGYVWKTQEMTETLLIQQAWKGGIHVADVHLHLHKPDGREQVDHIEVMAPGA